MLRWLTRGVIALGILALGAAGVGWMLPVSHEASLTLTLAAPQEAVFKALSDFSRIAEWRSDVDRVVVEGTAGPGQRVREFGDNGEIPYVVEELVPPVRMRTRIDSSELAFGGTWTFVVAPATGGGTTITVTEDGEIHNVLFRFMARFVFGYQQTLASYLRDLARRFGEG